MQHEAKASRPKAKGRGIHRITIDKMGNGFSVRAHHEPPDGPEKFMPQPEPKPMVFNKHAPAHKHVKELMQQMHPGAGEGVAGAPPPSDSMESGAAPIGTNP